jgi:hypothetical protein
MLPLWVVDGAQVGQAGGLGRGLEVGTEVIVGACGIAGVLVAGLGEHAEQQDVATALALTDTREFSYVIQDTANDLTTTTRAAWRRS